MAMEGNNLKAVGNWVFIKRDAQEKTHNDIEISDGAQVKSYRGAVHSSGSDKFVTSGDRLLIPHYGVVDYNVGGSEFAVVKDSVLYAKEKDDQFSPVNKFVKVLKCQNDHVCDQKGEVVLHMTDGFLENTNWVEILDVADDCEHLTKEDIGKFCVAPESSDDLQRILYSKEYCLKESAIEFVTDGD
jgi:co-chaperonin GroES (HSP10)